MIILVFPEKKNQQEIDECLLDQLQDKNDLPKDIMLFCISIHPIYYKILYKINRTNAQMVHSSFMCHFLVMYMELIYWPWLLSVLEHHVGGLKE